MSQINPFTSSIVQTGQVQRQQSVEKDRQVQRTRELSKNAALAQDRLEHQVESSEELTPAQREDRHERRFKKPQHQKSSEASGDDDGQDEENHLDLTA